MQIFHNPRFYVTIKKYLNLYVHAPEVNNFAEVNKNSHDFTILAYLLVCIFTKCYQTPGKKEGIFKLLN